MSENQTIKEDGNVPSKRHDLDEEKSEQDNTLELRGHSKPKYFLLLCFVFCRHYFSRKRFVFLVYFKER